MNKTTERFFTNPESEPTNAGSVGQTKTFLKPINILVHMVNKNIKQVCFIRGIDWLRLFLKSMYRNSSPGYFGHRSSEYEQFPFLCKKRTAAFTILAAVCITLYSSPHLATQPIEIERVDYVNIAPEDIPLQETL